MNLINTMFIILSNIRTIFQVPQIDIRASSFHSLLYVNVMAVVSMVPRELKWVKHDVPMLPQKSTPITNRCWSVVQFYVIRCWYIFNEKKKEKHLVSSMLNYIAHEILWNLKDNKVILLNYTWRKYCPSIQWLCTCILCVFLWMCMCMCFVFLCDCM